MLINVFERVPGHGEDAALGVGNWAIAVFDGLGGLGARPVGDNGETEAQIASRCARNCLRDFLSSHEEALAEEFGRCTCIEDVLLSAMRVRHEMSEAFDRTFAERQAETGAVLLPTNCAAALKVQTVDGTYIVCLWAGDARVYLLDRDGLAQLSNDDNDTGADALEDLRSAAPASQTSRLGADVSHNGGVHLALNLVRIEEPAVVLACSDGVYSMFKSPMHFELMLWRWLGLEPTNALPLMDDLWFKCAQDDCSLSALSPDVEQQTWQISAKTRAAELYGSYIDGRSKSDIDALWETYKPVYERHAGRC